MCTVACWCIEMLDVIDPSDLGITVNDSNVQQHVSLHHIARLSLPLVQCSMVRWYCFQ